MNVLVVLGWVWHHPDKDYKPIYGKLQLKQFVPLPFLIDHE